MRDYPNMSYCMNQNTLLGLRQILDAMQEDGVEFLEDMSREERRAFEELFHACEEFVRQSEELVEQEEDLLHEEDC